MVSYSANAQWTAESWSCESKSQLCQSTGIPSGSILSADLSGPLRTWTMCLFHLSITVRVWRTDVPPSSAAIWLKFVEVSEKKKKAEPMSPEEGVKKSNWQTGPAAGAVSKPAQALKDEIHFVLRYAPSLPDEGSRGEKGWRARWKERHREKSVWFVRSSLI